MKNFIYFILLFGSISFAYSQTVKENHISEIDSLYKEDQFYIAATYNLLANKPKGVSQSGFSSGFHLGYIKDMPINKKRNLSIGLGLGLSANFYNQNLLIYKFNGEYDYTALSESETPYSKNRFTRYLVEAPLEFRWRTSTATEYKFWRIYTGFKVGYLFASNSKYKGEPENVKLKNISAFQKFQYGLTLSAGFNTWNIHVYYGLNSVFNNAKLNNASIDINIVKIGLIFYLL